MQPENDKQRFVHYSCGRRDMASVDPGYYIKNNDLHVGVVPMHELLAHGFAEVAQEALYDVGPFVPEPDGTTDGSAAAGEGELHDDRYTTPPSSYRNRPCTQLQPHI